jgi:hypothetical protein
MGIKEYLKYIQTESADVRNREYDYFYLDCNFLIHYLIYRCKNESDLYEKLFNYWENLNSIIKIKKELYLVFDGEYDTIDKISNPKYQTHLQRAKSKPNSTDFDKQPIYPNSQIINTFKIFLTDIIDKNKKINHKRFDVNILSDSEVGEADIKILNEIYNNNQNNVCIFSKDSDMILIAQSIQINKIINIEILSNPYPIKFINMNNFKLYGLDYVLITLLLGNDYLPKISNVNYNHLIETFEKYIKFNDSIISNGIVNYDNLLIYITMVILCAKKKIKFNFKNIHSNRFNVYYNNLCWCLKQYHVISNNNVYVPDLYMIKNNNSNKKISNVINIHNFLHNIVSPINN